MKRAGVKDLAIYPEERPCHRPTAQQVFRLFALPARNVIIWPERQSASCRPNSPTCNARCSG